jgi:hypothetical protein
MVLRDERQWDQKVIPKLAEVKTEVRRLIGKVRGIEEDPTPSPQKETVH